MRFSLLYEIALPIELGAEGKTESEAPWEAVEQIRYADEMGLDGICLVERLSLERLSHSYANETGEAINPKFKAVAA